MKFILSLMLSLTAVVLGASEFQIRLAPNPAPADLTAAKELAKYLSQIDKSKQSFKIVIDSNTPEKGNIIYLGQSEKARKVFSLKSWDLRRDEIMYKIADDGKLYIAGDRTRGTLYAVYELLEREYGVRFYSPDCKKIPPQAKLALPARGKSYRYAPFFQGRAVPFEILQKGPEDWAAQMRQNGYNKPKTTAFGGNDNLLGWVHTFHKFLPIDKYRKSHPEWFAMLKGKRITGYGQLCLTNKEMRKEFIKNVLAALAKAPNTRFISVSQNDTLNEYCTCDQCNAFVKKYGNQTDLLLDFVNEVAAAVKKDYPKTFVETLAYNYTVKPPQTIMPAKNVAIRYCSIHAAVFHPINSETNKKVAQEILAWKKIAPQMLVWNYVTDHHRYYQPHPNWHVLADDLRFFRDCGAINIFQQGAYFAASHIADLPEMRVYLISKLLWNPDLDPQAIMKDFAEGYYGPGAPAVLNYINSMTAAIKAHPECKYNSFALNTDPWLDAKTMAKTWNELFSTAKKLEKDTVYGQRMAYAAMPLTMNLLERIDVLKRNPAQRLPELQKVNALELIKWCEKQIKTAKIIYLSEIQYKASDWLAKRPGSFIVQKMPFPNDGKRPAALPEGTVWYGWDIEKIAQLGTTPDKVGVVSDPLACNGKAIRQPNTHNAWYLKMTRLPGGLYDLYIEARCVPKAKTFKGAAFMFGNYPAGPTRDIAASTVAKPQYQLIKLGRTDLSKAQYVWCAPVINNTLKEFYIDRVILVPAE